MSNAIDIVETIDVRIESISGTIHDCLRKHRLSTSVLHTTKGRMTYFTFQIDANAPIINFIRAISECHYNIHSIDLEDNLIVLRENG